MPGKANAAPTTPTPKPASLLDALWKKLQKLRKTKPKIQLNPKHPISKRISAHNKALMEQQKGISGE